MADIIVPDDESTINAAISAASGTQTIKVRTGIYDEAVSLATAAVNGKTLTIETIDGPVTIQPSSGWPLLSDNAANTGDITFNGINIDSSVTSRDQAILIAGDLDLTVNDCVITAETRCVDASTGTGSTNRKLSFSNCVFNPGAGDCFSLVDFASLDVSGCTINGSNIFANFDLDGICGDISITDCEGSGGRFIEFDGAFSNIHIDNYNGIFTQETSGNFISIDSGVTTLGEVRITNCNLSLPSGGIKVESSVITGKVYLANNTIVVTSASVGNNSVLQVGFEYSTQTLWNTGQNNTVGQIRGNDGRIYICHQAINPSTATEEPGVGADWKQFWEDYQSPRAIIENNDCSYTFGGLAHTIFVGFGPDDSIIKDNVASGGNFQIVVKSNGNVIIGNICDGIKTCLVASGSCNTIINNVFRSTSDFALIFTLQDGDTSYSTDNYVSNNLISISAAAIIWSDGNNPVDGGDFINRNVYFRSDGGAIIRLGGTSWNTLSEVQAQWGVQSTLYGDINDQSSLVQDFGSKEGIFIDLDGSGIKEWVGIPQAGSGVGVWKRCDGFY